MIRGHDAYPGIIQRNFTAAGLGHLKECSDNSKFVDEFLWKFLRVGIS